MGAIFNQGGFMKKIKLFFLRNKEKLFRLLLVLSSVFCIFISSFSVFASGPEIYFPCSKPEISASSGYVEFYFANGAAFYVYLIGPAENARMFCSISGNYISFSCTGNYSSIYPSALFVGSDGVASFLPFDSSGQPFFDFSGWNTSLVGSHGYGVSISGSPNGLFTFVYGSDSLINDKLTTISNLLSSLNTTSSLNRNTLLTIFSTLSSIKGDIENTYGLIHNEHELTRQKLDKIIQILESAENGAYYNPADDGTTSTVTNQQQKDDEVMQGTSTGRTEANKTISGLSGLLTTTGSVFKGSTALTKVFNLFAQSAYLVPILQISLVLGISSFVLGTAFIVVGKIRNKKE